jgi:nicotinamide riboside transporter PnuC
MFLGKTRDFPLQNFKSVCVWAGCRIDKCRPNENDEKKMKIAIYIYVCTYIANIYYRIFINERLNRGSRKSEVPT